MVFCIVWTFATSMTTVLLPTRLVRSRMWNPFFLCPKRPRERKRSPGALPQWPRPNMRHKHIEANRIDHIRPLMSSRGNPYDNAFRWIFFSVLKAEYIYHTECCAYEGAYLPHRCIYSLLQQRTCSIKTKLTLPEKRCQFVSSFLMSSALRFLSCLPIWR